MSKSDILQKEFAKDFRRGLLKLFILKMLARKDMHGYVMMSRIEKLSGWKPSPGSMYPALMHLKKDGLINFKLVKMKKVYTITKKGKMAVTQVDRDLDKGLNDIRDIFDNL